MSGASPLEHVVTIWRTDHAKAIAAEVARRFQPFCDDCFGLWFHLDPSDLSAAIEEFDLGTGRRVRMGVLRVGHAAWVKGIGSGVIESIARERAVVRLARPYRTTSHVIAHRSLLKPHLRTVPA
ncbi:MAG: hypothetical protein IPM64_17740 [Phycisphaerales bacterium]|nr:hypothetical protein [Phycisphaerales bacterium]